MSSFNQLEYIISEYCSYTIQIFLTSATGEPQIMHQNTALHRFWKKFLLQRLIL